MKLDFNNVYINNSYIFLGRNEYKINIKPDKVINDYYMNNKTFEMGEVSYQKRSIEGLLKKTKLDIKDINLLIGSDLQNQLLASHFACRNYSIPFIGVYSACSSFILSIILSSIFISNKYLNNAVVTTSSNNLASEKQFRFPIEYGAIKKKVNTFTVSSSVSALISNKKSKIKVTSATIGKIIDIGYKDANNMGAAMAPSCADTIYTHLKDYNRSIDYYDLILTGDLGIYGISILKEYMLKEYNIKLNNVIDSGSIIFKDTKNIAGGSGPVCLPLVFFDKIVNSKYKRILLVGTGSLHTKLSTNISESIPSISHLISIELGE